MSQQQRHTLGGYGKTADHEVDWSQVGETLTMLALAIAQIDTSLHEGNQSINKLTSSFTAMADNSQKLVQLAAAHRDDLPQKTGEIASELQQEIQQAIIAFQFYDRLTQRLEHVGDSLERMGHLIGNAEQRYKAGAWNSLQQHIKSNYTMEAERIMFEHIMAGHSVAEALEIYRHHFDKQAQDTFGTNDDIEFF
ncbi:MULTISPECIES: hypothetical protein [Oceanospirillaceae]|jgi:hypothetical protein|uniref:hypothetical protein n=1 Tax=Oceanospirillaceae TaxID=135620 RepID=UPI001197236D|nr:MULTISPECIES: hypothetical protein [Thalassolituus]MBU2099366.1 hypothetical protein [Gammaproteobacteria bacterium]MCB2387478.1 hypothetical protein [Thalassolituus alkanivorans]MCB2425159.1 hypothetical protein [Thalassolituus alkanivorans]TVV44004.1 hypothetical protein FOT50_10190 [Thalassolituus sp. C2-1]|tara:strand:- start:594 stop:1175 length:582 start_codon:yes stop_codon:yes gene_type:complete